MVFSAEPLRISIDFGQTNGLLRPLHGVNKGPLVAGGLLDLTEQYKAIATPSIRLHDCHWPVPDVVDIHVLFPDFAADAEDPRSYRFTETDDYLRAIKQTGAKIVFRLGESIEHNPRKRFVHPPADPEKWAAVCLGIIRHYNEGWADGFNFNIRHWEIWNEPENRPAMWTGTDDQYFQLYKTTAIAIKKTFPDLSVGGPALGNIGSLNGPRLIPSGFMTNFLQFCQRENAPLDFFSWHCYTDNPAELAQRAIEVRDVLDSYGFIKTESHLNEWNYLPGNTWKPVSRSAKPEVREAFYKEMAGREGGAFVAAALIEMQRAPLDVANFFHGEAGGFGLFSEHGVAQHNYYAFQAFNLMLETPHRVLVSMPRHEHLPIAAGLNKANSRGQVLFSYRRTDAETFKLEFLNLPWGSNSMLHVRQLNERPQLQPMITNKVVGASHQLILNAPTVLLLSLQSPEQR